MLKLPITATPALAIILFFSLTQCTSFCSLSGEEPMAHLEEIRYDSYQKSLELMEYAPISPEDAFFRAMREKSLHEAELEEFLANPCLLGVRTKGNEYFFIIGSKSKYRSPREIGVYVSAINGCARFVLNHHSCVAPSPAFQYAPFITNPKEERAAQIIRDRFRSISQEYLQKDAP